MQAEGGWHCRSEHVAKLHKRLCTRLFPGTRWHVAAPWARRWASGPICNPEGILQKAGWGGS